jgi:phage shock protein A
MFEDLRAAFRQAVENFNRELHRDQAPETMDRLLRGMQRELVDAKTLISELESQVARARGEARHEAGQAEVCRRREEMARRIDNSDTADLAARYAERHAQRQELLEQKVSALGEELAFRRKDAEEMLERIKEARIEREGLTASTGRTRARDTLSEAGDLFSELDRMAEKIEGERHAADAAEELDELDLDRRSDFRVELETPAPEPPDVDAALAELKRRMGKDG